MKNKFEVEGMSCAACEAHVRKAVEKVDGVNKVEVSLLTNSMVVEYDNTTPDVINEAVKKAGYKSYIKEKKQENEEKIEDKETKILINRLISSIIFLIPLFYLSMGYMLDWYIFNLNEYPLILGFILMVLSFILMIINKKFFTSGFKALFHGGPNMDTLVALGSGVAFIYSFIIYIIMLYNGDTLNHHTIMRLSMNLAFETAGMVPTLITIGKTLEAYSKGKTTNALKELMDLSPKMAHIKMENEIIDKEVNNVNIGDIYVVNPGERIPLDGIIIDGTSSIDEASITGESIPKDKGIDDKVFTSTINKNGRIECKVLKKSDESIISEIIEMVKNASSSKAKISRLADKVAGIFVPVVISISLIVFVLWLILGNNFVNSLNNDQTTLSYAIERAIAVLVISCPCALGLATPVAIMVASGKAAKLGILFKNAIAIEEAGKAKYVVLDKTGTITKGEVKLTSIYAKNITEKELLQYAKTIEENSNHPLAVAIKNEAKDVESLNITSFEEEAGFGLKGIIDNKNIYAVSYKKALSLVTFDDEDNKIIENNKNEAKTEIFIIYDNKLLGILALEDEIKEDSIDAISEFKNLGITPILLSGDNYSVSQKIANKVGIDYFISNALPIDKQNVISDLKKKGKVMMIGDGINDAVALKEADIGVSIGAGTDIAKDSSDIVLIKSSLMDAVRAIKLSRYTILNIKENLFWAFFYNLIMIPIAAGVFSGLGLAKLKPWYGALAMSLSSFCVVMNALRINLFNTEKRRKKKNDTEDLSDYFKNYKKEENVMELVLNVEGMMCKHCKAHVEEACLSVKGVKTAVASLENKNVKVTFDEPVEKQLLVKAIKDAGYEA